MGSLEPIKEDRVLKMFGPPGSHRGFRGSYGPVGPTGPAGTIVPMGVQGVLGVIGVLGATGTVGCTGPTGNSYSRARRYQGIPDLFAYPPRYIVNEFTKYCLVSSDKAKKIVAFPTATVIPIRGGKFLTFSGSGNIVFVHEKGGCIEKEICILVPGVMSIYQLWSNPAGTYLLFTERDSNLHLYHVESEDHRVVSEHGYQIHSVTFISDKVFMVHRSVYTAGEHKELLTFHSIEREEPLRSLEGVFSFTVLGENRVATYCERRPILEEDEKHPGKGLPKRSYHQNPESARKVFDVVDIIEVTERGSTPSARGARSGEGFREHSDPQRPEQEGVCVVDSFSLLYHFEFSNPVNLFSYCQRLFARHAGKCLEFSSVTGHNTGSHIFPIDEKVAYESWRIEPISEERILLSDGTFGDGTMIPMYASKEDYLWLKGQLTELTGLTDPADVIVKFIFKF